MDRPAVDPASACWRAMRATGSKERKMSSIAALEARPRPMSPRQMLRREFESEVSSGAVAANDESALSDALDGIDETLKAEKAGSTASAGAPRDMETRIAAPIDGRVKSGTLTSDQGTEPKKLFADVESRAETRRGRGPAGAGGGRRAAARTGRRRRRDHRLDRRPVRTGIGSLPALRRVSDASEGGAEPGRLRHRRQRLLLRLRRHAGARHPGPTAAAARRFARWSRPAHWRPPAPCR